MIRPHVRVLILTPMIFALASLSSASSVDFSFIGGGITSSGTMTLVGAPDSLSGVSTPGTYEITGITGTFADTNDGISGAITGLYAPVSYVSGLAATSMSPVAFTGAGLSYDDLFFGGANAAADCPGYPFGGGYFDVYGVAFNISGGYVGEFFSNGILPGNPGPLYGAADASATMILDEPNAGSTTQPSGVLGSFTASPEPNTLFLLASGVAVMAIMRFAVLRVRRS